MYFAHAGNIITPNLPQDSSVLRCIITQYEEWFAPLHTNGTSVSNVTTESYNVTTYETTTPTSETVGFIETTVSYFMGTVTGPVNLWNTTVCAYVSS